MGTGLDGDWFEEHEAGTSLFGAYLHAAMLGFGDGDFDGRVTAWEAFTYAFWCTWVDWAPVGTERHTLPKTQFASARPGARWDGVVLSEGTYLGWQCKVRWGRKGPQEDWGRWLSPSRSRRCGPTRPRSGSHRFAFAQTPRTNGLRLLRPRLRRRPATGAGWRWSDDRSRPQSAGISTRSPVVAASSAASMNAMISSVSRTSIGALPVSNIAMTCLSNSR